MHKHHASQSPPSRKRVLRTFVIEEEGEERIPRVQLVTANTVPRECANPSSKLETVDINVDIEMMEQLSPGHAASMSLAMRKKESDW
ncbi:hypothetical protein ColKHC_09604 [Colletotrichum higginsianum]|nr:hypothetical protein ColKHC_09604 [Colletotrichum higginsianum]